MCFLVGTKRLSPGGRHKKYQIQLIFLKTRVIISLRNKFNKQKQRGILSLLGIVMSFFAKALVTTNLAKAQIPGNKSVEVFPNFCLNLFRDNRGLRFSVRLTSVGALFYFKEKKNESSSSWFKGYCCGKS